MFHRYTFFVFLLLVPALCCFADTTNTLSLEEAINTALSSNRSLRMTFQSLESRKLNLQNSMNVFSISFRPHADIGLKNENTSGAGLTVSKKTGIGTELSVDASTTINEVNGQDSYVNVVKADIKQPIFRGFGTDVNLENIKQAENDVKTALREIELNKTDLIISVVENYEQIISLTNSIEIELKTVERLDKFSRLTKAREKQGRSTRIDALRAELKLGEANLRLTGLQEEYKSSMISLADMMGCAPTQAFILRSHDLISVDIPEDEEALRLAMSNRLDYAQLIQDQEDAARGVKIARKNLLPDLNVIASYEKSGQGSDFSSANRLNSGIWLVSLNAASDLPLRNEKIAVEQATINQRLSLLKLDSIKSTILLQVRQGIASYKRTMTELKMAEENHRLAKQKAEIARRLYNSGKSDSFAVSDAEDELFSAQRQLLDSQMQASISAFKFKRILGTLLEHPEDLKPQNVK